MSNPKGVHQPVGRYHHLARVKASEFLFLAGQVAIDDNGDFVGEEDAGAQTRQAYANIGNILAAAGAGFGHLVQINTYLVGQGNLDSYLAGRADVFAEIFPEGVGPPNTLVFVDALFEPKMLVEIEVVAALP